MTENLHWRFLTDFGIKLVNSDSRTSLHYIHLQVSQFSRWSHAERLLALDQLIESCEPQQVRHMMQVPISTTSVCVPRIWLWYDLFIPGDRATVPAGFHLSFAKGACTVRLHLNNFHFYIKYNFPPSYVLSYLEPRDLLRAAQTCRYDLGDVTVIVQTLLWRYWRVMAEDNFYDILWSMLFYEKRLEIKQW